MRAGGGLLHWGNETVASFGNRLDKTGIVGRIFQGFAKLVDGLIKAAVKVNKGVGAPECFLEFVARDDFAETVNKQTQNCERLVLKFDADSLFPQFTRLQICFEDAETNHSI